MDAQALGGQFDRHLNAGQRRTLPLDLADERQYKYLMNRVLASGNTPDNAPALFGDLERKRDTLLKRQGQGPVQQNGGQVGPCEHFIHVEEKDNAQGTATTFTAWPVVSCTHEVPYVYVDIYAYRTNFNETTPFILTASKSTEVYGGKFFPGDKITFTVPKNQRTVLVFDSSVVVLDVDDETYEQAVREKTTVDPASPPPVLSIEHPKELLQDGPTNQIRICLERGLIQNNQNLDCDYATVKREADGSITLFPPYGSGATGMAGVDKAASQRAGQWKTNNNLYWPASGNYAEHLYLPLKGAFAPNFNTTVNGVSTPCDIEGYDTAQTTASIILAEAGGHCIAGQTPGTEVGRMDLLDALSTGAPVSSYSKLIDYGTRCLGLYQDVRLLVQVAATVRCPGDPTPVRRFASKMVEPLDFKQGCFAEGTRVTRSDGRQVAIESVKRGDKLVANAEGLALTITGILQGGEREPMVRLKDDQGHDILVTSKHPVLLADGKVVTADALQVGSRVKTERGPAVLTAVGRERYTGQVWNVALGTPEELAQAGLHQRTLFANGFLMGDSQMQTELSRQPVARRPEVLRSLPTRWVRDYQNDLNRGAHAL